MGVQVSKTQISGGSFFMKEGDTFLYSVEDPRGRVVRYGGNQPNLSWLRNVVVNPGDEGKKHLIYEGRVTGIQIKDGKPHYRYEFTKLWTTPDRFQKSGKGAIGPWMWSRFGSTSFYRQFYFGTGEDAPIFLSMKPKGSDYVANHTKKGEPVYSIAAPKLIPYDDPNIGVNGEFNRLSNEEILKMLNEYAMNASFTGRTSSPEVLERADEYRTKTLNELKNEYSSIERKLLSQIGDDTLTVNYITKEGVPESETMSVRRFLERGIHIQVSKDKTRRFNGIFADKGVSYDSVFEKEKAVIQNHRILFKGDNEFGGETVMPDIEFENGTLARPSPRKDIPFVLVKDPMDTDQISQDPGYSLIMRELDSNPSFQGWTQKKTTDPNGNVNVDTIFYKNIAKNDWKTHDEPVLLEDGGKVEYTSGMARGRRRLDVAGSEDKKVGRSPHYSIRGARTETPEKQEEYLYEKNLEVLGILRAYIEKDNSSRGIGGAIELVQGGSDLAKRMYLLSESLVALRNASLKAHETRDRIFDTKDSMEGFSSKESVEETRAINNLRTAIEQNDSVSEQISYASTVATTQFVGAVASVAVFTAIAFYSLKR